MYLLKRQFSISFDLSIKALFFRFVSLLIGGGIIDLSYLQGFAVPVAPVLTTIVKILKTTGITIGLTTAAVVTTELSTTDSINGAAAARSARSYRDFDKTGGQEGEKWSPETKAHFHKTQETIRQEGLGGGLISQAINSDGSLVKAVADWIKGRGGK